MADDQTTAQYAALQTQIDDLRGALESIRAGGVDAIITGAPGHEQVYSLTSADLPYRLLVEEMNEGALTVSDRGVVLYANATMAALLGRDPGALVGSAAADLVVPGDRASLSALLELSPGESDRQELALRGTRGPVPVLAAASCLDLEDTRLHCLVVSDLRDLKAVEARLRASERRLQQFLDAVPVGLRITDAHAASQYLNAEARRLLGAVGLTGSDVTGVESAYVETTTGAHRSPVGLPLDLALHGQRSHTDDLDLQGPDGSSMPVELWGTSILDEAGAVEFGMVAMSDVTARRENQRVIAEQATLLDLVHDAVMVWDEKEGITYWNEGAALTYGYPREVALGRNLAELLKTRLPQSLESIQAALDADDQWEGELEQVDATGRTIVVSSRWAHHVDLAGRRVGILEINRDITARRAAENALAERTQAVVAANLELSRSNEDLELFAYAASHDLAEPLRAISLPISVLSRRYTGQLDDDADTYIRFIVDGCSRMQQMIDSLLVYSRVGRLEDSQQAVDLSIVLKDVVELLGRSIAERDAVVTWQPLPSVVAQPEQMTQVFQNLLANALKFVPADTTPVIAVGAERRGTVWRLTVDDNGIGIAPEQRERVFGMFKRLHGHDEYSGTGIGLALVKKIVERQQGEVGVEDAPSGPGCRFWFTVPAADSTG